MMGARARRVVPGAGGPEVQLLDARDRDLDAEGLREWARVLTVASGVRFVSRSYRYPYAVVGWHRDPIGVDIETIGPYDEALADVICTPSERSDLSSRADLGAHLTSLWCAKEALAKALGDALAYDPARLESPAHWSSRRGGRWGAMPLADPPEGHAAWVCWRVAEPVRIGSRALSVGGNESGASRPSR